MHKAEKKYGFSFGRSVNFSGSDHISDVLLDGTTPTKERLDHEFSNYSKICCPCIGTASNSNLTRPQKELLLMHWKFGITMYCIQELMLPIKAYESSGVCHEIPHVIFPIFKSTPNPKTPPLCQPWQFAFSKQCMHQVNQIAKVKLDQRGALSQDAYEAGDFVSAGQYVVNAPYRLLLEYGKEAPHN